METEHEKLENKLEETPEMKCPACGGTSLFRMSRHSIKGRVLCGCSLSTVPQQYVCLDCNEQFWVRL